MEKREERNEEKPSVLQRGKAALDAYLTMCGMAAVPFATIRPEWEKQVEEFEREGTAQHESGHLLIELLNERKIYYAWVSPYSTKVRDTLGIFCDGAVGINTSIDGEEDDEIVDNRWIERVKEKVGETLSKKLKIPRIEIMKVTMHLKTLFGEVDTFERHETAGREEEDIAKDILFTAGGRAAEEAGKIWMKPDTLEEAVNNAKANKKEKDDYSRVKTMLHNYCESRDINKTDEELSETALEIFQETAKFFTKNKGASKILTLLKELLLEKGLIKNEEDGINAEIKAYLAAQDVTEAERKSLEKAYKQLTESIAQKLKALKGETLG